MAHKEAAPPAGLVGEFVSGLPFRLDPFQRKAIQALTEGRSVLVAAPTGTGKTVVAEFAVHQALGRGLRAIYTTPIKALSNQKFRDFRTRYGDQVGLLTGDLTQNSGGRLLVMTTEVARNMLIQDQGAFQDVGCLIFDEVHYLADPERGTAWEESILLAPDYVPLVCLSATVANAPEIAEWLRTTGRDVALIQSSERVVPLRHRYYVDGQLIPILDGKKMPQLPREKRGGGRASRVSTGPGGAGPGRLRRTVGEAEEAPSPSEVVRVLAQADLLPAIYFLFSRRSVEEGAKNCMRMQLISRADSIEVRRVAQERLSDLSREDQALAQVEQLLALLPRGIGFHHAGLLPPLKTLVEELLATGKLKVVFATDTLALGINVPARSTVIGELTKWDGQTRRVLTSGEYRQLTGRAGRRGMDAVGYSVLLYSPWVGLDRALEVAQGDVLPLESAFRPSYSTVLNLWHGPGEEERLAELIAGSLRQFQHGGKIREIADERDEVEKSLRELPTTCPVCGDFARWREEEKQTKREHDKAESAWGTATHEKKALEAQIAAWPWQHTKTERKIWLRGAELGAVAYSGGRGWLVYVGPSAEGIGSFFAQGRAAPLTSYSELEYLPEPPIAVPLPDSVMSRGFLLDGVASGLTDGEAQAIAGALAGLDLPDLDAEAREASEQRLRASEPTLRELAGRIATAEASMAEAARALAENPYVGCPNRANHRRTERERHHYVGLRDALDRDLAGARKAAARQAHRTLRSLRAVLEAFGYMAGGEPTRKAGLLRRVFDSNALAISELMDSGLMAELSPVELAEVASWFAYDKEGGRPLPITERLARVRAAAESLQRHVLESERRHEVDLTTAFSPQFRGVGFAWAMGVNLGEISGKSGLAEGDIVWALQKTLDICRQMGQAAVFSRVPSLSKRMLEAEGLLRRGVVASYYRWIVEEPDAGQPTGQ